MITPLKLDSSSRQSRLWLYFIVITLLAFISRLVPHLPNATGVMALAVFVGLHQDSLARASRPWLKLLPLGVMLLSDIFLGGYQLGVMVSVYGSLWLATWLGQLNRQRQIIDVALAGFIGSFLFYLITNTAVYAFGELYASTAAGLVQSLVAGLPFWRNSLIGDLGYLALFELGFRLYHQRYALYQLSPKEAHEPSHLS